jgi:hypothetical protein
MGIAFLMNEQGNPELRTQFVELRAIVNRQTYQAESQGRSSLFQELEKYHEEIFVAGLDLYPTGLLG